MDTRNVKLSGIAAAAAATLAVLQMGAAHAQQAGAASDNKVDGLNLERVVC
jgi:hypothetical protein